MIISTYKYHLTIRLGIIIFSTFFVSSFSTDTFAQQKMHPLKNYSVSYELSGNTTGTKLHTSQDYGRKQCWIETSEMNILGNSVKKNEKVITMLEDGDQWIITINLDDNTGTKMKNPMYKSLATDMEGKNPKEFSEEFMKKMGGKIVGEKTVIGEKCTEWTLMGGANTCVTEDLISVESGADMAGISITEVATEIRRNDPGPEGICEIGDAKIKEIDMSQIMGQ
ncbi:MAG: hypothetical protein DHS20C13_11420 [Thermodesulfobacteriota bacterium]|nr:MAG: hypothetical protein DHS20C13_11420 [Thermodesulfobacteriota bacterium]